MNKQDKELLLKDLSARLPYNPLIYVDERLPCIRVKASTSIWEYVEVDNPCKPYLRPMSSMTEEEKTEFRQLRGVIAISDMIVADAVGFDWLNAHHFDYRGLIDKGLAIEAPEGMYN